MFGKKKFISLVNKSIENNIFKCAKTKGFFDQQLSMLLNINDDIKYELKRAIELGNRFDDIKRQIITITKELDEISSTNIVFCNDEDEFEKIINNMPRDRRNEIINRDIIAILPSLAKLYDIKKLTSEMMIYWNRYIDIYNYITSFGREGTSEEATTKSLEYAFSLYDFRVKDVIYKSLIAEHPKYDKNKYYELCIDIAYNLENKQKWIEIYNDKFLKTIRGIIDRLYIYEFYTESNPNSERYIAEYEDFPDMDSCLWLPKRAQTKEFCLKLLEEYKIGNINGSPTKRDIDRVLHAIQ